MKIAFITLGCKLNYAETSTYERGFIAGGFETVPPDGRADVYLVNTCCVTTHSENKCRNIIRRCHRHNPDASIVVTGCYAEMKRDELAAIDGVKLVFGADEKARVVPDTISMLAGDGRRQPAKDTATFAAYSSGERTRSFLKVQDGCNNRCAYCTVPFARGASRNIPICDAVMQARKIAAGGIREIVITGVNTGDFGRSTGESFLDLLKALNGVDGIERYRISSIEPNLVTPEIIEWIASGTKFMPHFHIPLQSGSDIILKAVGRRYDTALFASRIDAIRTAMEKPGRSKVFFGIDVITGLPGETESLFAETYEFLEKRIRPAYIHVFPYSPRPGTRAAAFPDQVQDSIKTERAARLEELCHRLHEDFIEDNRGLPEKVLWESKEKKGMMSGYTGNYIRIERPYDKGLVGKISEIII